MLSKLGLVLLPAGELQSMNKSLNVQTFLLSTWVQSIFAVCLSVCLSVCFCFSSSNPFVSSSIIFPCHTLSVSVSVTFGLPIYVSLSPLFIFLCLSYSPSSTSVYPPLSLSHSHSSLSVSLLCSASSQGIEHTGSILWIEATPPQKNIWCWGFSPGHLGRMEYPTVAITPWSTRTHWDSTC